MRTINETFWIRHGMIKERIYDGRSIISFRDYTGLGESLGKGGYDYNSRFTARQMVFTLTLSEHPLLNELVDSDTTWETFDAGPLVEAKVLDGFKILDLGPGSEPTYARCSRHLGAIVYTLDVFPVPSADKDYHLKLDLRDEERALGRILKETNGEFDLVTCAFLEEGAIRVQPPENYTETIVLPVLREGGVYHNTTLTRGSTGVKIGNRLKDIKRK